MPRDVSMSSSPADRYEVISLTRHQPILAVPTGSSKLKHAAIERYQGFTVARKTFVGIVKMLMITRVDRFVFRPTATPVLRPRLFDFASWLEHIRCELDVDCVAVIVWPKQKKRHRLYAHLLSREGSNLFFAKIGFDDDEARTLRREVDAVTSLGNSLNPLRVPEVRGSGLFRDAFYALYEPLPSRCKHELPSDREIAELLRPLGSTSRLISNTEALAWWERALIAAETIGNGAFLADFRAAAEICVRPVHGDFGIHNLVKGNGAFWIFDWEESSPAGPCLADPVSFYFSINRRRIMRAPRAAVERFLARFAAESLPQLAVAVAFLAANNIEAAIAVARHWTRLKDPVA